MGLLVGLVAYYLLSLASAFWTARFDPSYIIWATLLSVLACVVLGFSVAMRLAIPIAASTVMIVLAVAGFLLGSSMYDWAAPLPADFETLLLHGGRSPLVIGAAAFTLSASLTRTVTTRRKSESTMRARDDRSHAAE